MEIKKTLNGKKLTVELSGRLDTNTSPELDKVLEASYKDIDELVLDLKDLVYISSAGLRVLLGAEQAMENKNGMTIINSCEEIMEVFEVTGFLDILNVE